MREYELEVLEQYEIEVKSTRKIRGAFFCETKEGTMLLKEADVSDRRAPLLYAVLNNLKLKENIQTDIPVFNRDGQFISTSRDGSRYMLKRWYLGRECDVKREFEVLQASRNLAELHNKLKWQDSWVCDENSEVCPPIGRHLEEEFLRHNRELKKVRAFMRNKVSKGSFEFLFLEYFDDMYRIAERTVEHLAKSTYNSLYQDSISSRKLVHGDYNYHNVIFLSGGTDGLATTNFEHFRVDVQVQDFYYFLRKVMEKHQWDESLGRAMLEAYESVRPLDARELEYLALCLAYPEKFWKTANTYYHSNKAWIPEKNVEKLQTAITQTEEKLRFLENIFTFNL